MKVQLLCTFTNKDDIDNTIKSIKKSYDIAFKKIYILQDENNLNELMCTYNVSLENKVDFNDVDNTISLHRKKYSNTLYTINALNELIKNLNNGVLDTKFIVPWENFKNMILVVNSSGLNKISTRIYKIISIEN
jgi:hypothetical protein